MKVFVRLCSFIFISLLLFGCVATKYEVPIGSTNDQGFIGEWKGEVFNEEGNYWRKWNQIRNIDGTYKLTLKYYDKSDRFLSKKVEKGQWWIKDRLFYEINPIRMSKPEAYKYEFISDKEIKFSSIQIDTSSDEQVGYSFSDFKVE